ncbi:hypothetical protein HDU81_009382 [Chytriomyces hyalinus]|nr:hypothetical protein HDU81_009382 [Chytriomyces hyalinus]
MEAIAGGQHNFGGILAFSTATLSPQFQIIYEDPLGFYCAIRISDLIIITAYIPPSADNRVLGDMLQKAETLAEGFTFDDDKPDKMYLMLQCKKVVDAFKLTDAEHVEQGKQFVSLNGYSFMIDCTGNEISGNGNNIHAVIPWGSRIKPVIKFAYIWVLSSSQDCFPVWTYVYGLRTTSQQTNSFSLLNELESSTETEEDVANKSFTMNLEEIEVNA